MFARKIGIYCSSLQILFSGFFKSALKIAQAFSRKCGFWPWYGQFYNKTPLGSDCFIPFKNAALHDDNPYLEDAKLVRSLLHLVDSDESFETE